MSEEKYRETIEAYNASLAKFMKKIQNFDEKQKKHLDHTMKLSEGNVVLDVGCGTGKDLTYLKNNYNILGIGLDRSDVMLDICNTNSKHYSIKGDMRNIPLKDSSCYVVISNSSLIHLENKDKEKALRELHRVLKKGGVLSIWIQNLYSFPYIKYFKDFLKTSIKRRGIDKGYAYDGRHWFYPSKKEMLNLLENVGFKVIGSNSFFSRWLEFFARPLKHGS